MGHTLCRRRVGAPVIEIGAALTEARVRRGLGLAEAAKGTRLRERYLHALELDQFDQLPPGSYRRGTRPMRSFTSAATVSGAAICT